MHTLGKIDHIGVTVPDIPKALAWYQRVLGLTPDARYRHLQQGEQGFWMISNPSSSVRIALRQNALPQPPCNICPVAFVVSGQDFLEWIDQLAGERVSNSEGLTIARDSVQDHGLFCSIAFTDLYGNPFEIVSYDHTWLLGKLKLTRGAASPAMQSGEG